MGQQTKTEKGGQKKKRAAAPQKATSPICQVAEPARENEETRLSDEEMRLGFALGSIGSCRQDLTSLAGMLNQMDGAFRKKNWQEVVDFGHAAKEVVHSFSCRVNALMDFSYRKRETPGPYWAEEKEPDALVLTVTNDLVGDAAPGKPKSLLVMYRLRGSTYEAQAKEGEILRIAGAAKDEDFEILRACYGSGTEWADAAEALRKQVLRIGRTGTETEDA